MTRDPSLPLAGAPDPWAATEIPSPRGGPPYHMTEMIEAEPDLAVRILRRLAAPTSGAAELARRIRVAAGAGRPIVLVGCGTSEHAALAGAEILAEAMRIVGLPSAPGASSAPVAIQALEATLDDALSSDVGLVIAVSHEGATQATNDASRAAREAGAETCLITVTDRSPGAALADVVLTTEELDTSWCHTVGYVSPILAFVAVAAHLRGAAVDVTTLKALMARSLEQDPVTRTESMASGLASADRIVVVGSGADRVAARELVLKIEEGTHLPAAMRDLETLLHGHLAGMDASTGVVLVLTERRRLDARAARARDVLAACREIGAPSGAILSDAANELLAADLTPLGRILVSDAPAVPAAAAALLGSAIPLQLLTERTARARGVDPDPIRRDDAVYLRAASI